MSDIDDLFDNFAANPFVGSRVNNTPQELAAFDPNGNPQPQGWVGEGALDVAAFAATIRPVILVTALPALPDADYPVGQFVYKTNDVPPRLYKNDADVWVAAVGPDDIQANSITAGQIAAGAVSTSELAVGARLTGEYANESGGSPGVFADSTGLLIRSGKLTLQDEFGETAMEASGFAGSWSDFVSNRLYNPAFVAGNVTTLSAGRTADLPYWTVEKNNNAPNGADGTFVGTGTLTREVDASFPGGFRVRMTWGDTNDATHLISDMVPVMGGTAYGVSTIQAINWVNGAIEVKVRLRWIKADGTTVISSSLLANGLSSAATVGATWHHHGRTAAPATAKFVQVIVSAFNELGTNASNRVDIGAVLLTHGNVAPLDDAGTTFPTTLSLNASDQLFYRTDLDMWFHWNGTNWLSVQRFSVIIHPRDEIAAGQGDLSTPISATTSGARMGFPPLHGGSDHWIDSIDVTFHVAAGGSALSGSHKWVGALSWIKADGTVAGVQGTTNVDSGASDSWRNVTIPVGATRSANGVFGQWGWTRTGTPGDLRSAMTLNYRVLET